MHRIGPGAWTSCRDMTWVTRPSESYWERLQMVARAGGYYGLLFRVERNVRHGEPLLPTIFNVVVDAVVRHWASLVEGSTVGGAAAMTMRQGRGQRDRRYGEETAGKVRHNRDMRG